MLKYVPVVNLNLVVLKKKEATFLRPVSMSFFCILILCAKCR